MDLTININDYFLNIRACAIIIHNNKILAHKSINKDHYALLGGRVSVGESSDQTVCREVKEELGKDIELIKYLTTVENFFEMNGSKYHEILFVYLAEFIDADDKKIDYSLENIEGKKYLKYEWLDINSLNNITLYPSCIKNLFKDDSFISHIINRQ